MTDPLAHLLHELARPMSEQEVGMMFQALLSSDVSVDVVDALLQCVKKAMRTFSPMSVASTLRFFATHPESRALPDAIYLFLCKKLEDVNARPTVPDVSLSLWGLAKLPISVPAETLSTLCRRALKMLHDFLPMHVVRALWSLAELSRARKYLHSAVDQTISEEQQLMKALWDRLPGAIPDFTARDISPCMHALARLVTADFHALPRLLQRAVALREELNAQTIGMTLWAFAKLRFSSNQSPLEFRALAERALELVPFFTAAGVAQTLVALTVLKFDRPLPLTAQLAKTLTDVVGPLLSTANTNIRRSIQISSRKLDCYFVGIYTYAPTRILASAYAYAPPCRSSR
jgi:hypothetical protein